MRIRDTNSCQQDRTRPFTHNKQSYKTYVSISKTSISTYQLDQRNLLYSWHIHFYVSTRQKIFFASSTPQLLHKYLTIIFLCIHDTSISTYLLDLNILSHPWHLHFFISTWPEYSIASSTPPFLCIYSTRIFHRIIDTTISTYLLHQNILSHPWHLHFYVSTQPKYSIASSTHPFLCIYLTRIFYRILDTSISSYQLDRNILSRPRHLKIFVSTRPKYYIGSLTPPFLRIYLTEVFFCILHTSNSLYLLNQNILSHPWHRHFFVSTGHNSIASLTPPFLCIYSTKIFYRILDTSISLFLLDRNIVSHPRHLQFFVSTQPKYSLPSLTPPFLHIYWTQFYCILDTSISLYLLDRNILSHPRHLHFFVSTRPKYCIASLAPQFLCIYSTRIFFLILDTSISSYLLDQNIPLHPWHLHFYVSTRPNSFASVTPPFLRFKWTKNFGTMNGAAIGLHLSASILW